MEYSCACGRVFESRRSLGCHKRYCAAAQKKPPEVVCQACGKSFSEERKLRDHTNRNVCGRKTECQFCDRTFDTHSGVRQHERKAHFEEYAAALARDVKPDPTELLTTQLQALAETEREIGPFPGRLAVRLGWTIDMVRYRRRLAQYKGILDGGPSVDAPPLDGNALPASASSGCAPVIDPPSSIRSIEPDLSGSRLLPSAPTASVVEESALLYSARAEPAPQTSPGADRRDCAVWVDPPQGKISSSPGLHASQVAGGSSPAALLPLSGVSPPDCPSPPVADPMVGVHGSPERTIDSVLALVSPELELSFARDNERAWLGGSCPSPLPSLTPSQATGACVRGDGLPPLPATRPDSGDEAVDMARTSVEYDHPVYATLLTLMEELRGSRRVRGRVEVLRLLDDALGRPMDQWHDIIDDMVLVLFPMGQRVEHKRRRGGPGDAGAPRGDAGLNRTHRKAAEFKKAQDLYSRHPRLLADMVVSGASLGDAPILPDLDQVMDIHGRAFESESPADHERPTYTGPAVEEVFGGFSAVTAEELMAARTRWPKSAPGMDGVTVQMVLATSDVALLILYNMILSTAYHPIEWRAMRTVMVPKGGSRGDPSNWRPITVGSALQRLLHRILNNRLGLLVDLSSNQRGFVPVDGTLANILVLQSFLDHHSDKKRQHALASLDLRKAFDSVSHHSITRALSNFRVPSYLSEYIAATLRDASSTIFLEGRMAGTVKMRRGVRQGDPLSPMLFNMVVDELLDLLRAGDFGAEVAAGVRCPGMAFADDFVLLADSCRDLQRALDVSEAFFRRRGMCLNPAKSRVLAKKKFGGTLLPVRDPGVRVGRASIPAVDDLNPFKYLGFVVGTSGVTRPCLTNYPGWMTRLLAFPLKPQQKMNLLRTHLLPRLFYGVQNCKISAACLKSIDRVTRHYAKKILHLHLHTPDALLHAPLREGGLGVTELPCDHSPRVPV
jgi:hypothetical protein